LWARDKDLEALQILLKPLKHLDLLVQDVNLPNDLLHRDAGGQLLGQGSGLIPYVLLEGLFRKFAIQV
jgi:hypothetical protein